MSQTKKASYYTAINIISGIGVLITNIGISFFLSPYIIKNIGVAANGFVGLAQNFVTYADLIVTALNAMAARFITMSYVKKDYKTANMYYNSVFWGNLFIVAVLLLPASFIIARLDSFINVPGNILIDVKVLFTLIFLSFFLRTGLPNWDAGTYVTNQVYRSSLAGMVTSFVRCAILVLTFSLWGSHVWFVGLATFISGSLLLIIQGYNTHVLTPDLRIALRKPICSLKAIYELVGSGIWSSIASGGNTLMNGLDLLICNLYIGPTEMGILAVSKSIPEIMNTFAETIRGSFGPELTIAYAKGKKEEVIECITRNIKISTVIVSVPAAGIAVMAGELYKLWLPSQNASLLHILTFLAMFRYLLLSGCSCVNNVFVTVNKVKYNSVALVVTGLANIVITLLLIIYTDWDIYVVAGVSSFTMIIKDMVFMLPVGARLLGCKWYQFFPSLLISSCCVGIDMIIGVGVKHIIPIHSWIVFFMECLIIGMTCILVNMFVVLNKQERIIFRQRFLKRLTRN